MKTDANQYGLNRFSEYVGYEVNEASFNFLVIEGSFYKSSINCILSVARDKAYLRLGA